MTFDQLVARFAPRDYFAPVPGKLAKRFLSTIGDLHTVLFDETGVTIYNHGPNLPEDFLEAPVLGQFPSVASAKQFLDKNLIDPGVSDELADVEDHLNCVAQGKESGTVDLAGLSIQALTSGPAPVWF